MFPGALTQKLLARPSGTAWHTLLQLPLHTARTCHFPLQASLRTSSQLCSFLSSTSALATPRLHHARHRHSLIPVWSEPAPCFQSYRRSSSGGLSRRHSPFSRTSFRLPGGVLTRYLQSDTHRLQFDFQRFVCTLQIHLTTTIDLFPLLIRSTWYILRLLQFHCRRNKHTHFEDFPLFTPEFGQYGRRQRREIRLRGMCQRPSCQFLQPLWYASHSCSRLSAAPPVLHEC